MKLLCNCNLATQSRYATEAKRGCDNADCERVATMRGCHNARCGLRQRGCETAESDANKGTLTLRTTFYKKGTIYI